MNVAVIGAGWAGLSAAVRTADLGHNVTVFEASHTLGGRARAVMSPKLQTRIDNGQHIMLGAYEDTLALMHRLCVKTEDSLQREPLALESADGTFRLRVARLPAPFHLLVALFRARGLFWRDKWQLMRAIRQLQSQRWQVVPDITVNEWLDQQQQSRRVRALFWQPLCVAALNTPVTEASAQLFANVLRDSVGSSLGACDVVLSRVDLSRLWPDQVERLTWPAGKGAISIRKGHPVRHLKVTASTSGCHHAKNADMPRASVWLDGEQFDAVIIATNAPSAYRLLQQLPDEQDTQQAIHRLLDSLAAFTYVPIATVTLRLSEPWGLPGSMYMLHEDRDARHYGQWLFNCPAFMQPDSSTAVTPGPNQQSPTAAPHLIQIVISDAAAALAEEEAALVKAIETQLRMQTRRFGSMPDVTGYELIAEKRATFAARPNLNRPKCATPWPQIWLAGDWTDTGYPAVLEGAVRSGQQAAQSVHCAMNQGQLFAGGA